ncbi:CDP-diacylglycerol--glycerol-3-phosphate 3-phosphatidyltransferase [Candidatus Albibeggiatoa sp. nov. BB20]|uniref:CDP-diacylglycerol--glycerol-3-phosphate 3-phosphatidyltransferase n=1 Tax=Candidatus Albibeggiatoa sp. nov. BB20 TaxID=3162723 RepID=UPI00336546B2
MNIPNILTLIRVVFIPILVAVYYLPFANATVWATAIFALAAITDWFDGYLARKWQQTSAFGAFLDPVADKLIVSVALILLVQTYDSIWITIAAAIIISREIVISALREWMAELGLRSKVAVSFIGKLKTTAQMLALVLLMYQQPIAGIDLYWAGMICLGLAALLTLWSMYLYLRAGLPLLLQQDEK